MTSNGDTFTTVRELRRRWKPHKERLQDRNIGSSTSIRFHRACSWMTHVEDRPPSCTHDLDLVSLWIAFNSLYGQWDHEKREPKQDRESWRIFVDRLLLLDESRYVVTALTEHKRLVMTVLEDEYLCRFFWQDPTAKRAVQSQQAKHKARVWYVEKRWTLILDQLLDRIYLMRCQLVHGAATHGSRLNRVTLRHCVMMIRRILSAFMMVWIDHGADEDWGLMCYPPL